MKYYEIEIDGIDRAGKDTLLKYLEYLGNYKYSINVRGILSQIVYSKKFARDYKYDLDSLSKNKLIVLLWAQDKDIETRCYLSNEKIVDYSKDQVSFMNEFDLLKLHGFDCLSFDTSSSTPYQIATKIINYIEKKEKENEL